MSVLLSEVKQIRFFYSTHSRIQGIEGGVLRVDTGDEEVDAMLRGYIKVTIDYREWRLREVK